MKSRMNYIKESILNVLSEVQAYQTRNPEIEGKQVQRLKGLADRISDPEFGDRVNLKVSKTRAMDRITNLLGARGVMVNPEGKRGEVGSVDRPSPTQLTPRGAYTRRGIMPSREGFSTVKVTTPLTGTPLDMGGVDRKAKEQFPGVQNVGLLARQAHATAANRMGAQDRGDRLERTTLRTTLNPLSA